MPVIPDPRYGRLGWEIIRAGRRLGRSGLITGAEGNVSALASDGALIITRAGARKDELTPDDLVALDRRGVIIRGWAQPSTELALHLAAYELCPDAKAVVHAHPIAATAFAAAEQTPEWRALAESFTTLGPVRLAPYAQPGTEQMAESLREAVGDARTLLLAHHGALTIGDSLEAALQQMELLERLCTIQCAAAALGGIRALPVDAQERLRRQ
jgi:L-fuculose-phosphate aldolase